VRVGDAFRDLKDEPQPLHPKPPPVGNQIVRLATLAQSTDLDVLARAVSLATDDSDEPGVVEGRLVELGRDHVKDLDRHVFAAIPGEQQGATRSLGDGRVAEDLGKLTALPRLLARTLQRHAPLRERQAGRTHVFPSLHSLH